MKMTDIDWDRIQPLRVTAGSHQPGSGKGCAMNVVSYITGESTITDYPKCSAPNLASLVQALNDELADRTTGLLSPEDALAVIEIGCLTIGTAGTEDPDLIWKWSAELLDDPTYGVIGRSARSGFDGYVRAVAATLRGIEPAPPTIFDNTLPGGSWENWEMQYDRWGTRMDNLINALLTWTPSGRAPAIWVLGDELKRSRTAGIEYLRWAVLKWRELAGLSAEPGFDSAAAQAVIA